MTRTYVPALGFPSMIVLSSFLTGCLSTAPASPPPSTVIRVVAQQLPEKGTRVIVWDVANPHRGATSDAAQAAIFELLAKEMIVTERAEIERLLHVQQFSLTHGAEDTILRVGRLMNAQQVVFVKQEEGRVHLRGVDAESGRILWTGEGWTVVPRYYRYGHRWQDRWGDEGARITHAILAELWKQDDRLFPQTAVSSDLSLSAQR